ncbi:MAG: 3-dehydroquinate synthase [Thermoanaerobaculia bacterium]
MGQGALEEAEGRLTAWLGGRTVFTLSSAPVLEHQGDWLGPLTRTAARTVTLMAPDGEAAKRLPVAEGLWQEMLAAGGKRDSRLIAFGGGTVGDLGGFLAGCYARGIEYVQVPTTLLAQADAAIGGKTGVDLPGGKNIVGLFHHPHAVVVDPRPLASLPLREWRCGAVEILKIALAEDAALFERVEEVWGGLLQGEVAAALAVLPGAIAAKIRIVEADPEEGDRRRVLNLGHTLAHALEAAADYHGLRHGEAVAYGLLFALRLATRRGLDAVTARRVRELLRWLELPPLPPISVEGLMALMRRDKKARESGLPWVLPRALGVVDPAAVLLEDEVRRQLEAFLHDPRRDS